MAFSFDWDAAYEASPASGLNRALIDDKLRDLARAVRARMEVGHNFGPYTDKDNGTHKGGYVEVMVKDDSAARDLLVDVRVGGLYLLEDGADLKLCLCSAVGPVVWTEISSLDHGQLDDLDADTHTQYLKTTGGVVTGLNLGGQKIIMPTDEETQRGLVQYYHSSQNHPTVGNVDAVAANAVTQGKVYILSASVGGNIEGRKFFNLSGSLVFLPNFHMRSIYWGGASRGNVMMSTTHDIGLYASAYATYRVNYRYIP